MRNIYTHTPKSSASEDPPERICDREGCCEPALYPAPKDRTHLREYFWFCIDHIREYNTNWNYYMGMNEDEIEHHRRSDTTWQRPTWPLGKSPIKSLKDIHDDILDPYGIFSEKPKEVEQKPQPQKPGICFSYNTYEARALIQLGLEQPVTFFAIKKAYKELAKQYHPDANNGDKTAEERLKVINHAYGILKKYFSS